MQSLSQNSSQLPSTVQSTNTPTIARKIFRYTFFFCGRPGHRQRNAFTTRKNHQHFREDQPRQAHLANKSLSRKTPKQPKTDDTDVKDEEGTTLTTDMLVSLSPNELIFLFARIHKDPETWILDSGATDNCTTNLSDFHSYHLMPFLQQINGICCQALEQEDMYAESLTPTGKRITITIKNAIYVPDLRNRSALNTCRLLLLSRIQHNNGGRLQFSTANSTIELPSGQVILIMTPFDSHHYYVFVLLRPCWFYCFPFHYLILVTLLLNMNSFTLSL